jgi:hypothetical protein
VATLYVDPTLRLSYSGLGRQKWFSKLSPLRSCFWANSYYKIGSEQTFKTSALVRRSAENEPQSKLQP